MNTASLLLARICLAAAGLLVFALPLAAQTGASGTIEGRVSNSRTGEYVERARVTVEGTGLETFTNPGGQYRLTNVPAGEARFGLIGLG